MNAIDTKAKASLFNLKSQLLKQGRQDNRVAETDLLSVIVKVYAAGGENGMHMHPYEDHAFIVMQGQATFQFETEDNTKVLKKGEGVMLPKGAKYCFLSSSDENLVMLRVGAATEKPEDWRAFPDGRPFTPKQEGHAVANKREERIDLPGQFYELI